MINILCVLLTAVITILSVIASISFIHKTKTEGLEIFENNIVENAWNS